MKSYKETVKIRVYKGGAWKRVDEAVSERLEIDANSCFMVTYNSDNDIVEDPQSDSANRKSKQVVGSLKHKKPSIFGKVKRLASNDKSSESDDESSESDEEGSKSDEDEETTPVENKNCKTDDILVRLFKANNLPQCRGLKLFSTVE
nr:hypothetical protein [Tanacetum cinerariifolium]